MQFNRQSLTHQFSKSSHIISGHSFPVIQGIVNTKHHMRTGLIKQQISQGVKATAHVKHYRPINLPLATA